MADITNPEAIAFCNEKIRPAADRLAQTYYFAKAVAQEWTANNLGDLIPVSADPIIDGSATDGRHPITANDVNVMIGILNEYIAAMEASGNQDLNGVLNVAVNVLP